MLFSVKYSIENNSVNYFSWVIIDDIIVLYDGNHFRYTRIENRSRVLPSSFYRYWYGIGCLRYRRNHGHVQSFAGNFTCQSVSFYFYLFFSIEPLLSGLRSLSDKRYNAALLCHGLVLDVHLSPRHKSRVGSVDVRDFWSYPSGKTLTRAVLTYSMHFQCFTQTPVPKSSAAAGNEANITACRAHRKCTNFSTSTSASRIQHPKVYTGHFSMLPAE